MPLEFKGNRMITRYSGSEGRRLLVEALTQQVVLSGDKAIVEKISENSELLQFSENHIIISQGEIDNSLYFILSGEVSINVDGRRIATRGPGQHIGEMALVDPSARRCATVTTTVETVLAKASEGLINSIATEHPIVWKNISRELAARLRQRNRYVRQQNSSPRVFVASSVESLDIAREIQRSFSYDNFVVVLWTDNVFLASFATIESLENAISSSDFAIIILGAEDEIISRGTNISAPRDNVLFELGLFWGSIGRRRTYIVKRRDVDIKIPSDLLGVKVLDIPPGNASDLSSRLGSVCTEIRQAINSLGPL